jgi:hypothetical protein
MEMQQRRLIASLIGQRTDDVLFNNGLYFMVAYSEDHFCKLSLVSGVESSSNWSISTLIDLCIRSDRTYNTPPLANVFSRIYIRVSIQQKISIPTTNADSDNVRCRFVSGDVCP